MRNRYHQHLFAEGTSASDDLSLRFLVLILAGLGVQAEVKHEKQDVLVRDDIRYEREGLRNVSAQFKKARRDVNLTHPVLCQDSFYFWHQTRIFVWKFSSNGNHCEL